MPKRLKVAKKKTAPAKAAAPAPAKKAPAAPKKATKKRKPKLPPKAAAKARKPKAPSGAVIGPERWSYVRMQAAMDYVFDASVSVDGLYARADRGYAADVSIEVFRRWAAEDQWSRRREIAWSAIEQSAERMATLALGERRRWELDQLEESFSALLEYLRPLRNDDGTLRRHELNHETWPGLPVFPLGLPSAEKAMRMLLTLHERMELLRGAPTARVATTDEGGGWQDPVGETFDVDDEDLRAIAIALQKSKDPELMEGYEALPPAEEHHDDDDDR